jgi:ABC-2 type transport system ATP-binding protein
VSEIGFLRGIWMDGSRRLAWLEEYAKAVTQDANLPAPSVIGDGIRLEHVTFSYPGSDRRALDDVDLFLPAGAVVAVVGENGAGKTTLLRICAGLERPDDGVVSADARVGYCPQQPGLFDLLSADEHLALFAPALGLPREHAIREGRRLLGELGFPVGERAQARRLSGGARQKLNLALALLGDARVLLLDEPYQGFDHGAYVSFWEHVERWRADGRAVVIVTHLLAETARVDRIVELEIPPRCGARRRATGASP